MLSPLKQLFSGWGFVPGLLYPLRAVAVLRQQPKLLTYIIVPLLINLILGLVLYWQLIQVSQTSGEMLTNYTQRWLAQSLQTLPELRSIMEPLVNFIAWLGLWFWRLLLLVLTGLILSQMGVLLGSPWYGKLSEQLEQQLLGKLTQQELGLIQDIGRMVAFELKKLFLLIVVGLICFGLNFLPGLGTFFATTIGLILTGILTCLDFFDPPLERRRLRFRGKLKLIIKSLPASAGFGLVTLVCVSIPIVNLVTIPLCIMAGTLFFCERLFPLAFESEKT